MSLAKATLNLKTNNNSYGISLFSEEPMTRFELVTSSLPSKTFINYISILQGFCNLIVTLFTQFVPQLVIS